MASFALVGGGRTLLIDPLLPDAAWAERLDGVVSGRVAILITIPYHVRSAEPLAERYHATVHGHAAAASRLGSTHRFRPIEPGSRLPGGGRAYPIGSPRRQEMPLWLPDHGALAFGDAVVGVGSGLRVWVTRPVETEPQLRWYRRLIASIEPLLDLDPRRVLVTHGDPVLSGGRAELERALEAGGWHHRAG